MRRCATSLGQARAHWENVIGGVYAFYKRAGDKRGQAKVLELISLQSRDPGSRDLAILRLAALKAETGNLQEAVITADHCQ